MNPGDPNERVANRAGAPISAERFEIREKLGSGGMGVVFRAYDRERRIEVALKTLRSMEGAALYRFKKEFRWLADLVHPNLVTLYELGSTGSQWFFTMELIDGVSLLEYVRPYRHLMPRRAAASEAAGPAGDAPAKSTFANTTQTLDTASAWGLPSAAGSGDSISAGERAVRAHIIAGQLDLDRLRAALAQLVGAVVALHRAGKLHRDIKPSNVLVTAEGRLALCDFGLVADADLESRTVEQHVMGTPSYMAPEQAEAGAVTEASDWYSVGVMLYEALTGRLPFSGSAKEVLKLKLTGSPKPPEAAGAELPEELARLAMALLQRDPLQRPSGAEVLEALGRTDETATPAAPARIAPPIAETALVGRSEPLAQLHAALRDSRVNLRCATVFIHGASGMGKTALARHFVDELIRGGDAIVLEGRCYERESVPYKALDALVDALSAYLLRRPSSAVEALVPPDITALSRLFPVLQRVPAIAEAGELRFELPDPHESRRRAFGALRVMLRRMSETQPVVLFVDDLQWGDLDSAGFLNDLLHHFESPALLFIATYRREEAESSPLLQALRKPATSGVSGDIREIALEALGEREARSLVGEIAGSATSHAELVDEIVRESGGNPLFLCELAHAGLHERGGVVRLDTVLQNRVEGLPAPARELLEAIAVSGQPILSSVAARSAGVQDEAAALAQLQSARLVRIRQMDAERRVECYHDRIRQTVSSTLSERELRRTHRRLARALETSPQSDPLALVEHWNGAGDEEKAALYAARAGQLAERALAFDRAAHNYRLALELKQPVGAERCVLLRHIGEALANAGQLVDAAETFAEAAGLAQAGEALELKRRAVEQFVRAGRYAEGLAQANEVLADVGMRMPRSTRRALLSVALSRAWVKLRGLGFRERSPEEVEPLVMRRMEVCWSLSGGLAVFEPMLGTAFQMRHLRMALRAGEPNHVALALAYEVGYRAVPGVAMRDECESLMRQAQSLAERIGHQYALAMTRLTGGLAAYLTGQWKTAHDRLDDAERMTREIATGVTWDRDVAVLFRMAALLFLGEIKELARLVPVYLREADDRGDQYLAIGLRSWRSNAIWLAMDDPDEAEAQLERAAAVLPISELEFHLPHHYRLLTRVQIHLYRGDAEAAWAAIEPGYRALHHSVIKRIQFTRIESAYLRARAALASARGQKREPMLRDAEEMARRMTRERSAWGDALAELVRGMVAAARDDRETARSALADAVRRFEADDMTLFAQVARWRQGEIEDGKEAAELMRSAEAWMREQQIVCPARFVALFAPLPD